MESNFIIATIDDDPCVFIPSITISKTSSFALSLSFMHNSFNQIFDSLSPSISSISSKTLSVILSFRIANICFTNIIPFIVIENSLSSFSFILPAYRSTGYCILKLLIDYGCNLHLFMYHELMKVV